MPNTPSPISPTSTATIHGLADRVAAYRALDLLLFEVIGSWITETTSANLRPYFAAWSQHHAWHAELWAGRFPSVPDIDLSSHTDSAAGRLAAVHESVPQTDVDRIRFLADELLPQLEAILVEHRATVVTELDAPTGRVLDLVIDDIRRDTTMARQLIPASAAADPERSTVDLAAALG